MKAVVSTAQGIVGRGKESFGVGSRACGKERLLEERNAAGGSKKFEFLRRHRLFFRFSAAAGTHQADPHLRPRPGRHMAKSGACACRQASNLSSEHKAFVVMQNFHCATSNGVEGLDRNTGQSEKSGVINDVSSRILLGGTSLLHHALV